MTFLNENLTVTGIVKFTGTNPVRLTSGTTAQRNALTPVNGMIFYNTDTGLFEGYANSTWGAIAGRDIFSFSGANNQVAPAAVTGLVISGGSFVTEIDVRINATTKLYETFTLKGIARESDFVMTSTSVGDNSGVAFTIDSSGNILYTSGNYSGFVSLSMKFYTTIIP